LWYVKCMMFRILLILMTALLTVIRAGALEVRLNEDRLRLKADHAPLRTVLHEFARAGVDVRLDPRVNSLVTADMADADMQDALDAILQPFGYVLIWDVIDGPVGPLPKLAQIQVFKPGDKKMLERLPNISDNLEVTRGPNPAGPEFVADEILLGVKKGTTPAEFRRLVSQIGGTVVASIPSLGIYQIRLARGANVLALVEQLRNNPLVAVAEPNYVARTPVPAGAGDAAGAATVSVPGAPEGAAAVAVLDSGLLASAGLDALLAGGYDSLNPERPLNDTQGHGTQMALVAAGAVQPLGTGYAASNGVPIIAVRAFDDNGAASYFSLMRGLDYALQNGARVVNLSWGTETDSASLKAAVAYAQAKGLIIVAAAGNKPTGKPYYPAAYTGVIGVSAVDTSGELWDQSNSGSFISVAAPGVANFPIGYKGPPGAYAGTSIASAYVSHALAQYLTQHPGATREQALEALKGAVTDTGAAGRDAQYGYGTLDAAAISRLLQ